MFLGTSASSSSVTGGLSQVSLIHASDSVRSMANGTPTTSIPVTRMSKPPSRGPAMRHPQPTPTYAPFPARGYQNQVILPTMSVPPMTGRSYDELTEFAEHQRKMIEANRREEERRQQHRVDMGRNVLQSVNMIRREVAEEESELRRLNELERETRNLRIRNQEKEQEFQSLSSTLHEQQTFLRTAASRTDALRRQLEDMHRRRQAACAAALVEHRKMQQEAVNTIMNRSHERIPVLSEDARPRASVEPFNVVVTKIERDIPICKRTTPVIFDADATPSPPCEPGTTTLDNRLVASRQDVSPSPPKDPHPTKSTVGEDSTDGPSRYYTNQPADAAVPRPTSFGDSLDETKLRQGRTDNVSLRSDSLKATKRRSWAASDGTTLSETDVVRRFLLEEQKKGKTHYLPEIAQVDETPAASSLAVVEESVAASSSTEEESSSVSGDEKTVEMEMERRPTKGILKAPGMHKEKKNIEFDPLALLLDAALEGELDLVKTSANKLKDVSVANDEGITALHNAICAGHYEIVKFLIEANADVNAQDSDGWTPLHCAASCNNLPMVRQLVEGGACVLASTLSDSETPVEKCEEEEEGYDNCLGYLAAAHNGTGVLNEGRVYAAYDYTAQFDDELSFVAGEELHVIRKDDKEKNWWTCEKKTESGKEAGLAPRTYLALYPALCHRKRLNFIMFNIPVETNNNDLSQ